MNSDLTETGVLQAQAVRDSVEAEYDVLVSSDLGRAVQTAEIIREKLKLRIILDEGLRERNLYSCAWRGVGQPIPTHALNSGTSTTGVFAF